jgi:uncharacterized protein
MIKAKDWIEQLGLKPHPEGGYYREVYRADERISKKALPDRYSGDRSISTAIYYLLEADDFSAFHRVNSDECWHLYAGGTLEIFVIHPDGRGEIKTLGKEGEDVWPMHLIPHGCWFAAKPAAGSAFTLVGCTVSPGFDFVDFELAERDQLRQTYPQHTLWIDSLTR